MHFVLYHEKKKRICNIRSAAELRPEGEKRQGAKKNLAKMKFREMKRNTADSP